MLPIDAVYWGASLTVSALVSPQQKDAAMQAVETSWMLSILVYPGRFRVFAEFDGQFAGSDDLLVWHRVCGCSPVKD